MRPRNCPAPACGSTPTHWLVALFQAEGARLVQLARWFVDDRTAAEDLVQEAFLRLARNQHRINEPDRAAAYLRSIVVNLARDHNRRGLVSLRHRLAGRGRRPLRRGPRGRGREPSRGDRGAPRPAPPAARLPCLRYYLEMWVDDVAEALGLSRNSVKTHLRRGLRALEQQLEGTR